MSDNNYTEYTVPEGTHLQRADKILAAHFTDFSRTQIHESFKSKLVFINDKPIKKNLLLSEGDVIRIQLISPEVSELIPVDIPVEVLYEDDHIVAINKAPGIVTHPGIGTGDDTLVHAMLFHTKGKLSYLAGKLRPGVVHRLDKETSGIIIFAKTDKAYLALIKLFAERHVDKQYLALASGSPHLDAGSLKFPIERSKSNRLKMSVVQDGKEAHTDWSVEKRISPYATLFRLFLHTGRTHQIRVHLSYVKHPILGDETYQYRYRPEHIEHPPRVMLHAARISLPHPIDGTPLVIESPLPADIQHQIKVIEDSI